MKAWLNDVSDKWNAADPTRVKDYQPADRIPDGPHQFVIVGAEISDEKPMIKYRLRFKNFNNRELTKVTFIGGNLDYTRKEFATLGIDNEDLQKTLDLVPSTVGLVIDGAIKTKPNAKYSDIYFNRVVGREEVAKDPFNTNFDPAMFEGIEDL